MCKILAFLFLSLTFANAQLLPRDMQVSADSAAPTPVVEQPAPTNMVEVPEGQSGNWDGYEPANPDSLKYYEVESFRNGQEATRKHAIANVLKVVALGVGFVGLGVAGAGYLSNYDGKETLRYVGGGLLVGSLVSMGFAFGFDLSAEGLRIKSEYYNQKLVDYKKSHSSLGQE